jgi:hypothetical protein
VVNWGDPARFEAYELRRERCAKERTMSLFRGLIKGAVVAKVIQVAQRELAKPANQRKIKDGLGKLSQSRKKH